MKRIILLLFLLTIATFIYAGITIANDSDHTFLISIGIDRFRETTWNLNFCVADAIGIYESFPDIPNGNKFLLTNEGATKNKIEQTILYVTNKMERNDFLILFVATHGFFDKNDFYFTPHDFMFDNISGNMEGDTETGISSNWLLEIFYDKVNNNSNSILIILDTCFSGSMGFDIRRSYDSRTGAGLAQLYSSSPIELSWEDVRFGGGHGVFSYSIIDGLSGNADKNNDGIITFRELFDHVYFKVKELTNDQQNPVFIGAMRNDRIIKRLR